MKTRFPKNLVRYLQNAPFVIVDAGARGGLKPEWLSLRPYLKGIGFEPDPAEFERLSKNSQSESFVTYLPTALWNAEGTISLHITRKEGLSGTRLPNTRFLKHFDLKNTQGYEVSRTVTIPAARLDDLLNDAQRKEIDFFKIDVEGGAFEILSGSKRMLEEACVMGLRIEAEFNPKYTGQHLFSDVDHLLRKFNYQLFDIRTCRWKRRAGLKTGGLMGQLVHGDFIYFMESDAFFEKIENNSQDRKAAKLVKYLIFACLYGAYDLAMELLGQGREFDILAGPDADLLAAELCKSQSFWMRFPKLQGRGPLQDFFYHVGMATFGFWLGHRGYWKPEVELESPAV